MEQTKNNLEGPWVPLQSSMGRMFRKEHARKAYNCLIVCISPRDRDSPGPHSTGIQGILNAKINPLAVSSNSLRDHRLQGNSSQPTNLLIHRWGFPAWQVFGVTASVHKFPKHQTLKVKIRDILLWQVLANHDWTRHKHQPYPTMFASARPRADTDPSQTLLLPTYGPITQAWFTAYFHSSSEPNSRSLSA